MSGSQGMRDVDLLVTADFMVPMTSDEVIHDAAVAVRDGAIVRAGGRRSALIYAPSG